MISIIAIRLPRMCLVWRAMVWEPGSGLYLDPRAAHRANSSIASNRAHLIRLPGRKPALRRPRRAADQLRPRLIGSARKVAMQYSPLNAIPYVSMVDAGTVEMVRAQGCKVVTSADLVQKFEASWTAEQYRSGYLDAGSVTDMVTQEAFAHAAFLVQANTPLSEYELQQWILERFRAGGITTAEPPIVAVGPHTADPHYEPKPQGSAPHWPG